MSKLFFLLAFALCMVPIFSFGQTVEYANRQSVTGPFQCTTSATLRDAEGNFYITGTAEGQVFTEKKSRGGSVIYEHIFSDPPLTTATPEFIAANSAGEVFVAGSLSNALTGQAGIMLYGITPEGDTVWTIEDTAHFDVNGLTVGADGNPIVALVREKYSDGGIRNFDLIKYNASTGAVVWNQLQSLDTVDTSCSGIASSGSHLYAAVYREQAGIEDAISYDESTGKTLWTKPEGLYSTITSMTPRDYNVTPSGDFLVTGQGSGLTSGAYWTVTTFDLFRSSDGAFVFRSAGGPMSGSDSYTPLNAPTFDSHGNIYWSGFYRNGSTEASNPVAGKLSPSGGQQYLLKLPLPAGNVGASVPGKDGESFFATTLNGQLDITALNAMGHPVYSRTFEYPFLTYGVPVGMYVDTNGDPSVVGTSLDAINNSANRLVTINGGNGTTKVDSITTPKGIIYSDFEQATADDQGNIYVAGVSGLFCGVTKYSASGATLWSEQINLASVGWQGFPAAISWSSRGEIVLAAEISANYSSSTNLGVAKLNASTGAIIWSVDHVVADTSFYPVYVKEDSLGNVYVAGEASTLTIYQEGVITEFAEADGSALWQSTDPTVSYFSGMAIDSGNNVLVTGAETQTSAGEYEVRKYNSAGAQVYLHTATSANTSGYNALAIDATGNAYEACFDRGQLNLYKYGPTGTGGLLKSYTFPVGYQVDCEVLFSQSLSALYIMATQQDGSGNYTTYTIRANPTTGASIWTDTFQRGTVIYNPSLGPTLMLWDLDKSGNVVLAGLSSTTTNSPSDIIIRKLKFATGAPQYSWNYSGGMASPLDYLGGVVEGSDGLPVVFGSVPSTTGPGSSDGFIFKIAD
ncbi:MAG TPA: hypothetical protein VGL56_21065 [Fimbriimonadaceae bacterium]|jgi:sugar lactone lactonase YvrE